MDHDLKNGGRLVEPQNKLQCNLSFFWVYLGSTCNSRQVYTPFPLRNNLRFTFPIPSFACRPAPSVHVALLMSIFFTTYFFSILPDVCLCKLHEVLWSDVLLNPIFYFSFFNKYKDDMNGILHTIPFLPSNRNRKKNKVFKIIAWNISLKKSWISKKCTMFVPPE